MFDITYALPVGGIDSANLTMVCKLFYMEHTWDKMEHNDLTHS